MKFGFTSLSFKLWVILSSLLIASVGFGESSTPVVTPPPSSLRDPRIPVHQYIRPQWAVQLTYSPNSIKSPAGEALAPQQGSSSFNAFTLQADFQPRWLQGLGVIGLGPRGSLYPFFGAGIGGKPVPDEGSIWGVGGQIRYQARYFRNQIIVPVVSYAAERFRYLFVDGRTGTFLYKGPTAGVWILLNSFEPSAAGELYVSTGVSRTYLVAEANFMTGQDVNLNLGGNSYYFGIRVEF